MNRQFAFEELEQRNLMSVSLINNAVTVSGDDGNVVRNDAIVLRRSPINPALLQVLVNGQIQLSRLVSAVSSVQVNGRGGNDTLTISNGNDTITLPTGQPLRFVRDHLSEVVDQVSREHDRVEVTRNGRVVAVIVSSEELSALEETLAVLSDPEVLADIRAADIAYSAGDVVTGVDAVRSLRSSQR